MLAITAVLTGALGAIGRSCLTNNRPYSFSNRCNRFAGSFARSLRELPEESGLRRRDHCSGSWSAWLSSAQLRDQVAMLGPSMAVGASGTHKIHGVAAGVISGEKMARRVSPYAMRFRVLNVRYWSGKVRYSGIWEWSHELQAANCLVPFLRKLGIHAPC